MSGENKTLSITCGMACMLKDREGMLDNYDIVRINCGEVILSSEINAKLNSKSAKINAGSIQVKDIKGEVIQLDKGAVIDGSSKLKGFYVIAKEKLIITADGMKALEEAEGLMAMDSVFYPESAPSSALNKVTGKKKPYPDDAHVLLGDYTLENLLPNFRENRKHIYISGRLTAVDRKAFVQLSSGGYTISCSKLFTYEGLYEEFGKLINCGETTLVPDGYEITGKIKDRELSLYGKKLFVDGKFSMCEDDISDLEDLEAIIVKGKASLPSGAIKTFKAKGKADEYFIFDGRLVEVYGFGQFSHSQLDASNKKGEKLTLMVSGVLLFDDDVTPEDIECIASLTYNGTVIVSGPVKSELMKKTRTANGVMGDSATLEKITGKSIKDLLQTSDEDKNDPGITKINMGNYMMI